MRNTSLLTLLAVITVGFISCGPELVHEQLHPLPGYWSYADSIEFQYEIQDTAQGYDLVLTVSHTDVFPTQNLYTRFVTIYPNGLRSSEPVSLEVADKFGEWLGDCSGESCELRIPLQQGAKYPEAGKYGLTIHQYGRRDSLQALNSLGLNIYVAVE